MRKPHLILVVLLLTASVANADVVWPALYLESRLFSFWAIGLGLFVEYFFIWKVFNLSPKKALIADLCANAASSVLGGILIPLVGIGWEFFPGSLFYRLLNWGTFNPVTWAATFIFAFLINALLENLVLKWFFKLPFTRRTFAWLALANAISVSFAYISLWIKPIQS